MKTASAQSFPVVNFVSADLSAAPGTVAVYLAETGIDGKTYPVLRGINGAAIEHRILYANTSCTGGAYSQAGANALVQLGNPINGRLGLYQAGSAAVTTNFGSYKQSSVSPCVIQSQFLTAFFLTLVAEVYPIDRGSLTLDP